MGIPVALTIQIDTITKPGSKGAIIPANVASTINFSQTRGPLHGLLEIVAEDPKQTSILGNILMTYEDRPFKRQPSGSPMFGYLRRGFQGQIVASVQQAFGSEQ
jgi:hypothetical protein